MYVMDVQKSCVLLYKGMDSMPNEKLKVKNF